MLSSSIQTPGAAGTTSSKLTTTSSEPGCAGIATYTNYAPEVTVYVTVDGDYTVTVTENGTAPYPTIFYTPPPACSSTVICTTDSSSVTSNTEALVSTLSWTGTAPSSLLTTVSSAVFTSSTTKTGPPYGNLTAPLYPAQSSSETPHPHPQPQVETSTVPIILTTPPASSSTQSPLIFSGLSSVSQGTTTITVTKKTPVPVSIASASSTQPAVQFPGLGGSTGQSSPNYVPSPSSNPSTNNINSPLVSPIGTPKLSPVSTNNNNNSPTLPSATRSSSPNGNNTPLPTATNPGSQYNNQPSVSSDNNQINPSNSNINQNSNPSLPLTADLSSIIISAFNAPLTSIAVSTSLGAASPTATLINGVPVQVNPSSIYIGGSSIALASPSSTATLTINGQTYTINPTQIIATSTTLTVARLQSISYSAVRVSTLPASTITQNGITVTINDRNG